MTMPKMTGDVLALHILKINPDIPVIICTGYSDILDKDAMINAGVKAILTKPFSIEELVMKVKEYIKIHLSNQ
jgi:CheY-like chemotaxis protein